MSSPRALQARLDAWRSFRDIAHATRSLAAAQVLRWNGHARQSEHHLAWVHALADRALPHDERRPGPPVLLAFGTDLGLCGRLNQAVADEVRGAVLEQPPALLIAVGVRLADALADAHVGVDLVREPAPSSIEAVAELADRVEAEVVGLSGRFAPSLTILGAFETTGTGGVSVGPLGAVPVDGDGVREVAERLGRRPHRLLSETARLAADATALLVHARVIHAACAAARSESNVRLQTMTRAHESAEERIGEQERELRKARQETITQEMLEVLSGRPRRRRTVDTRDVDGSPRPPEATR